MTDRVARRRRVSIRLKVAAVMCVPVATLAVVVALEVLRIADDTDEIRRQAELATAADGPGGLIKSLQDERSWAAVELIGQGGQVTVDVEGYEETRRRTDEALAGFRDELDRGHDDARAAFSPAIEGLSGLRALRDKIDGYTGPRDITNPAFGDEIFSGYTQLIEPFFTGTAEIAGTVVHPELRQGAGLIDTSSRQVEVISALVSRTFNYALLSDGGVDQPREISDLSNLVEQFKFQAGTLRADSTGPYAGVAEDQLFVDFTEALASQVDDAMRTGRIDVGIFLDTVTLPTDKSYNGYRLKVGAILRDRADELNSAAVRKQRLYLGLILAMVAAAFAVIRVVSRSITRPLRTLTRQATEMASEGLPRAVSEVLQTPLGTDVTVSGVTPITIDASDEVVDVAVALNTVQSSALDLAVGQAVLRRNIADSFVHLGQRNQALLGRQVDFITELEQHETDADNLANLFQLDHLATRMRRNAESLLVLAGVDTPRQWSAPVRVSDVIRAATSEVEDYPRVIVRAIDSVAVWGRAAADVVHLLAELIENALIFSPPDMFVEIRGQAHSVGGGYSLAIVDAGIGMSPEELAQANRRLAGAESFTVAPSKYLGHYVAGHLAIRHGIHIHLAPTAGNGVTATVLLPATVLATGGHQEAAPLPS